MTATAPRPLVPEDISLVKAIPRAAWASVRALLSHADRARTCAEIYPNDAIAHVLLQRAATTGATTTVSGWASQLVPRVTGEWLGSLAPGSAAAALIARGVTVSTSEGVPVAIPIRSAAPTVAPFVAEDAPIPMRQWTTNHADLNPKKVAVITALSKELVRNSNAMPLFLALLAEDAAAALDAAYFGTDDGSAAGHHAGLLAGLTPLTGTAVMIDDLSHLAEAVAPGGSGELLYVASPGRSAAANLRIPAQVTATILPSLVVPADRLICVDAASLVHGFGDAPEIVTSEEALLHMEDTTPLNIATGAQGSGVLATPTQSMFQTAQIATRCIIDVGFCARRSGAVAFMNGCTW
jgi:hypothetical protein